MSADARSKEIARLIASGAPQEEIDEQVRELIKKHAQRCPDCGDSMIAGKVFIRDNKRVYICLPCTGCPCGVCAAVRASRSKN